MLFRSSLISLSLFSCGKSPSHNKGYYDSTVVWDSPSLVVCWENPSEETATEQGWVQDKVARTWQKHSALTFEGWQACADEDDPNLRILIADAGAHTKGLGNELDGKENGIVLNFAFGSWNAGCQTPVSQRKSCIESIAAHEFGHAIGLAHEHNRDDRSEDCTDPVQGSNGDIKVGPFDRSSIMNYCFGSSYENRLSAGDKKTIALVYGPPEA